MKVKLKDRSRWFPKQKTIEGNYYHYGICFLKRKVSAPKRPRDSKARCPLSFSFEIL